MILFLPNIKKIPPNKIEIFKFNIIKVRIIPTPIVKLGDFHIIMSFIK